MLKSPLKAYESCIPNKFDLDKFRALLDEDEETCKNLAESSAQQIESVKEAFQKFIKQQQQAFMDFTIKQQTSLYGKPGASLMDEWEVTTPGQPGEDI